jgi:nucleotide-binding universal stress UspA family protein
MKFYTHILVPLDGSEAAEAVLPHVFGLAKLAGATVTLLWVVPPIEDVIAIDGERFYVDDQLVARKERALRYLDAIRKQQGGEAQAISIAVETGPPAATILEYADRESVDVIVMATHGRSGVQRWLLGSVAEKVSHAARQTVILVRSFPVPSSASAAAPIPTTQSVS